MPHSIEKFMNSNKFNLFWSFPANIHNKMTLLEFPMRSNQLVVPMNINNIKIGINVKHFWALEVFELLQIFSSVQ